MVVAQGDAEVVRKELRLFPFDHRDFAVIAEIARSRAGIMLGPQKSDLVYARLSKRVRKLGFRTFRDYCLLLTSPDGEAERDAVVNALTTNLTRFFREPHHFEHLARTILPEVARIPAQDGKRKRLRIWSAACSSGEEPYSIALTVLGAHPEAAMWDTKILATDIDTDVLGRARTARYMPSQVEKVPLHFRPGAFEPLPDGSLRISRPIRSLISFKTLNLHGSWPMKGPFDAIFCRNVMIYFDRPIQTRLIDRMADMLVPGGALYLGHSESLHGVSRRFELTGRTIYRKTL